jgi:O-antigen/teichoic acid export membrane protein
MCSTLSAWLIAARGMPSAVQRRQVVVTQSANIGTEDHSTPSVASPPARGVVQLFAAHACFMGSGYFISVLLARGLGPAEYGDYGVILSVLVWIEIVAGAGITGAVAKLIPQHEGQALVVERTARTLLLLASVGLFCLCWFSASAFARLFDIAGGEALFRLAIVDLPLSGLYFSYRGALLGNRRFGVWSLGLIIYSQTKLAGIVLLILLGPSVSGALLVNVLATAGALLFLGVKSSPSISPPSLPLALLTLRVALPIALYLVTLQVLLSLDLWCLKGLGGGPGEVVGFYVAAGNVARLLLIVPTVLAAVLFPSLSWALGRQDETVARDYLSGGVRFAFILLPPIIALLALHAGEVMELFFSSAYAQGGIYLGLQLVAFGLFAFFDIGFQALMAAEKLYRCAGILVALVPIALASNFMLIPRFGAMGAAASLLLTIGLGTMIAAVLVFHRFGSVIRTSTVFRVSVATALILLIGAQISVPSIWLPFKLAALFSAYAVLLTISRELRWQELRALIVRPRAALQEL